MIRRPEIDGLRAFAVLPVIFFHAGFRLFSGGFIGVDIFFVISGFLITSLILEENAHHKFSILKFYARRARRILPALFCIMIVCVPFGFLWMLPIQYKEFSESLLAVIGFVSNVLFWKQSGYFALVAEEKPLLHTWSLGVEEQFYIFFPLMLVLLMRLGKQRALLTITLIALISLALCEYCSRYYINVNFFLIPTRAWELFAGSICAFIYVFYRPKKNDYLSLLGLILVLFSIFYLKRSMRLPSTPTLVPVLGSALILLYGTKGSIVARILSLRLFVGIGLISYSAYLWHQPLFAFARIYDYHLPPLSIMLILTIMSLLLATLTWKYIEQPFRNKHATFYVSNKLALKLAALCTILLLLIGLHGYFTEGRSSYWIKHTKPNQVKAYHIITEAQKAYYGFDNHDCVYHISEIDKETEPRLLACEKKYGKGIAIIGDSHSVDTFLLLLRHRQDRSFIFGISQGGCRPDSGLANCYYSGFLSLLNKDPGLFSDVIYVQAGGHLFSNSRNMPSDRSWFLNLPLDAIPVFSLNQASIRKVAVYLTKIASFSHVIWLGPRIEPEIPENAIIHLGCDYPFKLRPKQAALFERLDKAIRAELEKTPIHYRSQIDMVHFDITRDFITCEKTYWKDGDHYSLDGVDYFSNRITLDSVLKNE